MVLPPRFHHLEVDFERMLFSHKCLDWVSMFFLLMAKNKNKSLMTLKLGLVFHTNDECTRRYMNSLQEMVTCNESLRHIEATVLPSPGFPGGIENKRVWRTLVTRSYDKDCKLITE